MTETINGSYTEEIPTSISLADFFAPVFENKSGYEQVMEETVGKPVYLIERYEVNKGIFQHIQGHPYPQKGIPPQADAIFAANQVKRLIINTLRVLGWRVILLKPKTAIKYFNDVAWKIMSPYMLKYDYMTNTAQGVYDFTSILTDKLIDSKGKADQLGKILAMIIELDSAYRFRLIDIASETTTYELHRKPIREIRRLIKINRERDYESQHSKAKTLGNLLLLALMVPKFRKAWRATLKEMDWDKICYDASDRHWACYKNDYLYFGLTFDERQKLLHSN